MNTFTRFSALCCCALLAHSMVAQTVTGRVVDGDGRPLPYANVVAMSLPDSAFVAGVMTRDDGTFTLDAKGAGRLLRFSSVGYKTVFADVKGDIGTVRLDALAQVLGEVVVKSDLPKTRLKAAARPHTQRVGEERRNRGVRARKARDVHQRPQGERQVGA